LIARVQQGLKDDGVVVSVSQLCRWFEVPRRTVYYRPTKSAPKVQEALATPIKALIEEEPSFGYRTVAGLLDMNKNTVQRIFQLKGWQVSGQLAIDRASRPCHRWRPSPMSAGPRTCAECGVAAIAGCRWHW